MATKLSTNDYTLAHLAITIAGPLWQAKITDPNTIDEAVNEAIELGHTLDIRYHDDRYSDNNSWTRVHNFRVSSDEVPIFRQMVHDATLDMPWDTESLWFISQKNLKAKPDAPTH